MMQHGNGRNEILPATATAATNVTYFPTVWPQKNGLKTSFSKENSEPLPHPLNATKRLHVMLSALLALWQVLNNVGLLLAPLLPPHLLSLPLPFPLLLLRPQLLSHIIIYHQI